MTYIYGLKDPRDGRIYYIGKSDKPKARLWQHMKDTDTNRFKAEWIADVVSDGHKPVLTILAEVQFAEWEDAERRWIADGIKQKWPLTNIMPGGSGYRQQPLRRDWQKIIAPYLSPEERAAFASMSEDQQFDVCWQAAMVAMQFSWIAIQEEGGDPKTAFDADRQFRETSEWTRRKVCIMCSG